MEGDQSGKSDEPRSATAQVSSSWTSAPSHKSQCSSVSIEEEQEFEDADLTFDDFWVRTKVPLGYKMVMGLHVGEELPVMAIATPIKCFKTMIQASSSELESSEDDGYLHCLQIQGMGPSSSKKEGDGLFTLFMSPAAWPPETSLQIKFYKNGSSLQNAVAQSAIPLWEIYQGIKGKVSSLSFNAKAPIHSTRRRIRIGSLKYTLTFGHKTRAAVTEESSVTEEETEIVDRRLQVSANLAGLVTSDAEAPSHHLPYAEPEPPPPEEVEEESIEEEIAESVQREYEADIISKYEKEIKSLKKELQERKTRQEIQHEQQILNLKKEFSENSARKVQYYQGQISILEQEVDKLQREKEYYAKLNAIIHKLTNSDDNSNQLLPLSEHTLELFHNMLHSPPLKPNFMSEDEAFHHSEKFCLHLNKNK